MQISDFLYAKSTPKIIFPPESPDPSYFLDLKDHLDKNPDYRKARIEWRKTKPLQWDLWRIKEEYFQEFCAENIPLFHSDIELFIRKNPGLSVEETAQKFCNKWRGYEKTYGIEFVERAIRRLKQ